MNTTLSSNLHTASTFLKRSFGVLVVFVLAISFTQCNTASKPIVETPKVSATDPFKNTMVPSQYFTIDAKQDNVVEGNNGTVLVFPKGCFKNSKGDVVDKNVKVELAEALHYDDMLASNLTTTSKGKPLETDGMIYFNATADGEQLAVNKENPVHIEIPTAQRKPGMQAWKGTRDKDGNMDWAEPQEIDNYLTTVDLDQLDFLPEGFAAAVENGMPFKNHKTATKELIDSLFYSLTPANMVYVHHRYYKLENIVSDYNEAYYSKLAKVVAGKYTPESYHQYKPKPTDTVDLKWENVYYHMGIDPTSIKVLKTKNFANTLIATREFQQRLQAIYKCCGYQLLDLYVNNLDKNLYEIDSMACVALKDTPALYWGINPDSALRETFTTFYQQHLTKVKDGGKNATLFKNYYAQQIQKGEAEATRQVEKLKAAADKKDKAYDQLVEQYEKLLDKREKYRMETYGFNWTETGWINIDNGTVPKTWGPQPLQVTVENGKDFDQVYTYVVYETIKSLYRLNTTDKQLFYVGNDEDKSMLMPKHARAVIITIAYKGNKPALAVKEFETGADQNITVQLKTATSKEIKEAIHPFEKYKQENRISVDLEYMQKFYKADQERKTELKELAFIIQLWDITRPCWYGITDGLFGAR